MTADRRESLRRSLQSLAESYAATMRLLQEAYALLTEEACTDPSGPPQPSPPQPERYPDGRGLVVDEALLTVLYHGRSCYLGNSLPFRLLARLARHPNRYFTHDELLAEVWDGDRSPDAIRSVVKTLRQKLRQKGLDDLAAAIDGSASGRYALRLPS
jgi:DNA-binding response OmpR family regulator